MMAYMTLYTGTGKLFSNWGVGITPTDFQGGYFLLCFDLSPQLTACASLKKEGTLGVKVTFNTATTEPVVMLVYGDFDTTISINKNRQVLNM